MLNKDINDMSTDLEKEKRNIFSEKTDKELMYDAYLTFWEDKILNAIGLTKESKFGKYRHNVFIFFVLIIGLILAILIILKFSE